MTNEFELTSKSLKKNLEYVQDILFDYKEELDQSIKLLEEEYKRLKNIDMLYAQLEKKESRDEDKA